jgi:hypothetical protein
MMRIGAAAASSRPTSCGMKSPRIRIIGLSIIYVGENGEEQTGRIFSIDL